MCYCSLYAVIITFISVITKFKLFAFRGMNLIRDYIVLTMDMHCENTGIFKLRTAVRS